MIGVFLVLATVLFSIGAGVGWFYTIAISTDPGNNSGVIPKEIITYPIGCFSLVCTVFAMGGLFACWRYFVG